MYIPGTTCLHIPLAHSCLYYFIKSSVYCFAHFILLHIFTLYCLFLFNFLPIFIYILVLLLFLHCPLSGPDLIYISLLIIFCIIEHVTNKQNLEPWTCSNGMAWRAEAASHKLYKHCQLDLTRTNKPIRVPSTIL